MPLKRSASKKAFVENLKTEMEHGHPKDQSLAIAYSVQRQARKKHAKGGKVDKEKHAANHAYNYDDEMSAKGVNKVVPTYTKGGHREQGLEHGRSEAGSMARKAHTNGTFSEGARRKAKETLEELRAMPNPKLKGLADVAESNRERKKRGMAPLMSHKEAALKEHARVIEESRKIQPKLKGLAEGGEIPMAKARKGDSAILGEDISMQAKRGGKFPLKHPKMVEGILNTKLRTDEDDLMDSAAPASPEEQPPEWMDEEEQMMAKGGNVKEGGASKQGDKGHAKSRYAHEKGVHPTSAVVALGGQDQGRSTMMGKKDRAEKILEELRSMPKPKLAEGGDVSAANDIDEVELEHAASLAAAIMAKRRMARGGEILSEDSMDSDDSDQADLARNAEEDANMLDKADFDALRKENYSESDSLDDLDQPEDSNMHGHESNDDHDESIVGSIRRKMKKRSPISE